LTLTVKTLNVAAQRCNSGYFYTPSWAVNWAGRYAPFLAIRGNPFNCSAAWKAIFSSMLCVCLGIYSEFKQRPTPTPNPEIHETLAALRSSLLGRIQLEQLHSRHPGHPPHHHTLIAQLDQQLDTLLHTDTEDPSTEAARLLHDAVELGIQVHREMRRL
jgi:hypothetical protein